MRTYVSQVLISLFVPLVVVCGVLLMSDTRESGWSLLFLMSVLYGYTHFIGGWYFQVRSMMRTPESVVSVLAFCGIAGVILLGAYGAYAYGMFSVFGVCVLISFVAHGYFNECTFFREDTGGVVPYALYGHIALWCIGALLVSMTHQSAFVTPTFTFYAPSEIAQILDGAYATLFRVAHGIGVLFIIGAYLCWCVAFTRYRAYRGATTGVGMVTLVLTGIIATTGIVYVYLYFIILTYHFTTWLVRYARRYRGTSSYGTLVHVHVYTLIPLVGSALLPLLGIFAYHPYVFFNLGVHFIASGIHIATSFLNEPRVRLSLKSFQP